MDVAWWDARTLTEGAVVFDPGDRGRAEWVRFRLADELQRRFYPLIGLQLQPVFFPPSDGDLYSHPLVSEDCLVAPRSFGRLSTWRIALDRSPVESAGLPWAALAVMGDEWSYEGQTFPSWDAFLDRAVKVLGLEDAETSGHERCSHRRQDRRAPDVYLLAVLVRTHLGTKLDSRRWHAARSVHPAIRAALGAHPRNSDLEDPGAHWLVVVEDVEAGRVLALRHDGLVATPLGPVNAGSLLNQGVPALEVAGLLEERLVCGPVGSVRTARSAAAAPLAELETTGLPLNRKERFYTGTVLPALVTADDFRNFGVFTALAGLGHLDVSADPAAADVQLFTEYGFSESVIVLDDEDRSRFGSWPTKEAPDLVAWMPGHRVLLAVEAKMFHRPDSATLAGQLGGQRHLLLAIAGGLSPSPVLTHQVVLGPQPYLAEVGPGIPEGVVPVTWEELADAFRLTASPYWLAVLDRALRRWPRLRSTSWGPGTDYVTSMSGREIVRLAEHGDLQSWWIGRSGGLAQLAADVQNGSWAKRKYRVREEAVDKPHWVRIEDFLTAVRQGSAT